MTPVVLAKYFEFYLFSAISPSPIATSTPTDSTQETERIYTIHNTLPVPVESLYIKTNPKHHYTFFSELEKNLLSIESDQDVNLTNMAKLKSDLDKAEFYLRLFNIFILVLLFILAFFLLLVFFLNMIRERRWEFAVLRAIGFKFRDIRLVYLMEIGSNVLSALLVGAIVGFIFSTLSGIQFTTFNEIRLK